MRVRVLVIDSNIKRRAAIKRLVVGAGGQAMEASTEPCLLSGAFDAAIIGLTGQAQLDSEEFKSLVGALRQRQGAVFCHSEGSTTWPLAARCELLLLGATSLFDSDAPDFASRLQGDLGRHFRRRSALVEDESLLASMLSLGMVGCSPAMLRMFERLARFAPLSELPVLVSGETGTGKELVINALKQLDTKRAEQAFVPVNCAALPKSLAEAELFGHRRGAFSGAESHRLGLVRAADHGILFLDEVGDLDLTLQSKLLRVLQERRVLSVGEDKETPVDVRILAATHRDLKALVAEGRFREDLFYRLAVLPLNVPPLRQRAADIPLLVAHFIRKYASLCPQGVPNVAPEFIEGLSAANLTGNVRQLENLVQEALVGREPGAVLGLRDLPEQILREVMQQRPPAGKPTLPVSTPATTAALSPGSSRRASVTLAVALRECERSALASALDMANGSQVNAARLLGISERSVYTKMRKHGLDRAGALPPRPSSSFVPTRP